MNLNRNREQFLLNNNYSQRGLRLLKDIVYNKYVEALIYLRTVDLSFEMIAP